MRIVRLSIRTTVCSLSIRLAHGWSAGWELRLKNLKRAESLKSQLYPDNALGYRVPETTKMLREVLSWKEVHPEMIILVRVGEFYETWGIDAVMLVEYAGLNAMGGKPRAGCPIRNIQQTLDALTAQGFTIAVYEEEDSIVARLKKRKLAQIVSPGRPIYVAHGSALSSSLYDGADFDAALPYAAVQYQNKHYRVALLDVDARLVTIAEELTEDGARSILSATSKLYYTPGPTEKIALSLSDQAQKLTDKIMSTTHLATNLAKQVCAELEIDDSFVETQLRFQRLARAPVLAQTAREIGIPIHTKNYDVEVPPLLEYNCDWLRRWLLSAPSQQATNCMRQVQEKLEHATTVPKLSRPPSRRKMVRLLADGEASANLMREIVRTIHEATTLIDHDQDLNIVPDLIRILNEDTSITHFDAKTLQIAALTVKEIIHDAVVFTVRNDIDLEKMNEIDQFFAKNEHLFRDTVHESIIADEWNNVKDTAHKVRTAAAEIADFGELSFDSLNNLVALKNIKKMHEQLVAPLDRYRRPLTKRWTSERLDAAIGEYVKACDKCATAARKALRELARHLYYVHLDAILCAAGLVEAAKAAIEHARYASRRGWCLPKIASDNNLIFKGLVPYWLEMGQCIPNDVSLNYGQSAILTGPNQAGKSTLLRSVGAATLLAARGLRCPARSALFPQSLDSVFLRAASRGDAPSFGKSAFAREMDDVALLFRECRADSTVILVDEIGKGTSPTEAAALGAAILAEFSDRNFRGIFATHLHREIAPILDSDHPRWQMQDYNLVSGVCADSLALQCAQQAGVPEKIIHRASCLLGKQPIDSSSKKSDLLSVVKNELALFSSDRRVFSVSPCQEPLLFNSCLYVLNLGDCFYVGESDDLATRLQKHRKKGSVWCTADAYFITVNDKSLARRYETLLLRRLIEMGIPLESTADANRRLIPSPQSSSSSLDNLLMHTTPCDVENDSTTTTSSFHSSSSTSS
mmetsp:Transcript_7861/g.11940  ORF Transcript_7861/g.11940 Transcript_7861/m.11940 type:complete len:979 (+) Transcript_7861:16-2952(+)